MNVRKCGQVLERALRDADVFMDRDCCSDYSSDVAFLSFDGTGGFLEEVLGGDYESSVSFCVSRWEEISVEIYFSNARARVVSRYLPSVLRQLQGTYDVMSTPYVPGESALSCRVTLGGVDDNNVYDCSREIIEVACFIIIQLAKAMGIY